MICPCNPLQCWLSEVSNWDWIVTVNCNCTEVPIYCRLDKGPVQKQPLAPNPIAMWIWIYFIGISDMVVDPSPSGMLDGATTIWFYQSNSFRSTWSAQGLFLDRAVGCCGKKRIQNRNLDKHKPIRGKGWDWSACMLLIAQKCYCNINFGLGHPCMPCAVQRLPELSHHILICWWRTWGSQCCFYQYFFLVNVLWPIM